jgi:hypothetical protein
MKHKVLRKSGAIAFDLLIEPFRRDAIESRQIRMEQRSQIVTTSDFFISLTLNEKSSRRP